MNNPIRILLTAALCLLTVHTSFAQQAIQSLAGTWRFALDPENREPTVAGSIRGWPNP